MFIALRDIRRSKTRFGLLAAAVGLLFFLVLFVNTVSGTLLDAFVGAISNSSADVLVYDENAQFTIQASRLDAETVQAVSAVPDAAAGSPLSVLSLDAEHSGRPIDISLWGLEIGAVGTPPAVTDGRLPGPGEVLFDDRATTEGIAIGDVITVAGVDLTVVGLAANASFAVLPTGYVDRDTFAGIFAAEFPGATEIPVNLVAVAGAEGVAADDLATTIDAIVPGVVAVTPDQAASSTPGVSSISQSFGLITGVTFVIVVVIVGFFFQILTVQRRASYAVLKAVGAGNTTLAWSIAIQIVAMVLVGAAVGTGLLAVAASFTRESFSIQLDWALIGWSTAIVLVSSLLAGAFAMSRIVRQDPAIAAMGAVR